MTIDSADSPRAAAPETSTKPPAKRNRIQLSCTHCRHAKLKCDRGKPCLQCIKRGRSSSCTFLPPVTRKRPAVSMQNKLKHLESLVKGAMTGQPSDESMNPPILDPQNHVSGRVVGPNDGTYVGATHWAAMLDDIEEVKGYFSENMEEISLGDESVRPDPDISLLFNNTGSPITGEDLWSALPERNTVNRLVSQYFNSNSPALHVIHKPTFQKNYRKFWVDPRSSPISFLALIYSIMSLGILVAQGVDEESANPHGAPTEMIQIYRGCCVQCLALSNYAKHPGPYTLETLLLYIECELLRSKGDQMSCYLIVGVAVRLALRMGLHRDSDKVESNITPYQGEIRRRVWHLLVQMDLLISFDNGLPSMVQSVKSDTRVPLNLQDQDFDEYSTKLPPSRPETEITGMSYTLAKGRLARVFGKIVEQVNLLIIPSYAEVKALEGELQEAFSAIPPFLRVVPIDLCITDSSGLIIRRLSLAVLFQKSRCILHRKYLIKEKESVEFSYSKKAAMDASRELLRIQSEVHDAAQPGGILCKDLWVISSLAMHDLLLAAVITYLCLIQESMRVSHTMEGQQIPNACQTEVIAALERSYKIWFETRSLSVDTKKACDVLRNMLKRLNSIFRHRSVETDVGTVVNDASGHGTSEPMSRLSLSVSLPELSTRVGGGQNEELGDAVAFPSSTTLFNLDFGSTPIDIVDELTDTPMNFDWDTFDAHIRRQTRPNDQSWADITFPDFNSTGENDYNLWTEDSSRLI